MSLTLAVERKVHVTKKIDTSTCSNYIQNLDTDCNMVSVTTGL